MSDEKEDTFVLVGSKFPALPRKSTRTSQGYHFHQLNTSLSPDVFLNKFNFHL